MQSRVMCNSLCSVRVNIMNGRPLVAIRQKTMDRIRNNICTVITEKNDAIVLI